MVFKIISGGQVGADRAGLDWALENGFAIGGWCPKGRRALDGRIPDQYLLQECDTDDYPRRTMLNVTSADATLIFTTKMPLGRGSALTERCCIKAGKPYEIIDGRGNYLGSAAQQVVDLVCKVKPLTLNIAGTRDMNVTRVVRTVMDYALARIRQAETPAQTKHAPDDPKKFFRDRLASLGLVTVEDSKQSITFHDATGMPVKLRQNRDNESVWLGTMQLDKELAERVAATLFRWVETGSFLAK